MKNGPHGLQEHKATKYCKVKIIRPYQMESAYQRSSCK